MSTVGDDLNFHEFDSSCNLFAKKILGHKSMRMTDKYLDDRGNGYVEL